MVAVRKAGINVFRSSFHVVGNNPTVNRSGVGMPFGIGDIVTTTAGNVCEVVSLNYGESFRQIRVFQLGDPVRDLLVRRIQRKRSCKRMVPIPAGDNIIAFGALLRKNFSQHGKLFGAHSASGIVCRHVRINKYQLMPITCGVSCDHETAVKVKEFCKE